MRYIEIDKDLLPYTFEIELDNEILRIEVYYNERFDYFTLDLYHEDEAVLFGEKLLLGSKAFEVISYLNLIVSTIKPEDLTAREDRITFENMNDQVFLYVGDNIE